MTTPEDAISELKELQGDNGDVECQHVMADDVLRRLLTTLGHKAVIDEYDRVPKWFA